VPTIRRAHWEGRGGKGGVDAMNGTEVSRERYAGSGGALSLSSQTELGGKESYRRVELPKAPRVIREKKVSQAEDRKVRKS